MRDDTLTLAMAMLAEDGIHPDPATVAAAVAHVGEAQAAVVTKMADGGPPGNPPRPGLVWNRETHRWRSPETGDEQTHEAARESAADELANHEAGISSSSDVAHADYVQNFKDRNGQGTTDQFRADFAAYLADKEDYALKAIAYAGGGEKLADEYAEHKSALTLAGETYKDALESAEDADRELEPLRHEVSSLRESGYVDEDEFPPKPARPKDPAKLPAFVAAVEKYKADRAEVVSRQKAARQSEIDAVKEKMAKPLAALNAALADAKEAHRAIYQADKALVKWAAALHADEPAHVGEAQAAVTTKLADPLPTTVDPGGASATAPAAALPPASSEVALAGRDGKALARIVAASKARGVSAFNAAVRAALKTYAGTGPLLDKAGVQSIADAIATVNATAELTGRARVREIAARAAALGDLSRFADEPDPLARAEASAVSTPEEALSYFSTLFPSMGVDPQRFAGEQRRRAFTLALAANGYVTERVRRVVADALAHNRSVADATARISDLLDASGATTRNPQYAEMVFRTNAMDSFQTGMWEEGRHPDVRDTFPAWQYLGIDDHRAGEDHRPKFDKLYPARATFADVRGPRPFNCRCSMRWVDRHELAALEKAGHKLETRW